MSTNLLYSTLEQRLDDIKYWKEELEKKLDDMKVELDALLAFKNRVAKALESTADPLHIVQQCLGNRYGIQIKSSLHQNINRR